jgi:rSAM/selenodomain-associated transferase 2
LVVSPTPLAVVVPALNEAQRLPLLLADLAQAPAALLGDWVVVDGGSSDATARIASLAGARVVHSPAGRGRQLQRGVEATTAPWLLLLHADCRLPAGWAEPVVQAMAMPAAAWAFDLAVEGHGLPLRLLELAVRLRSQLRQLPYGDQGLLLPRSLLQRAGGVPEIPLMEDLRLIQALQPLAAIRRLGLPLRVDGRRWRRRGVVKTALQNARLRRAWRLGQDPEQLAQLYYDKRGGGPGESAA